MLGAAPAHETSIATLIQMAGGYAVARCLHVVADLGIADALDETPRSAQELAQATGTNPGALARVLRLLAAYEIFEQRDGLFAHTPASRLLRDDHPQSMRALVRMFGSPSNWTSYGELHYSVRTGECASGKVWPGGFWKYLADHPDDGRLFDQAMSAKAQGETAALVLTYDFSRFGTICDIGGGRGHLLEAVLKAAPKAKGVLFDLPRVAEQGSHKPSERLRFQGGDFFKDDLPVADCYIMMDIIHDWNDEDSAKILKNMRRATPKGAKLLLLEAIIPDDPHPCWAKVLDIHMLTLPGGRQRTQHEFTELLAGAAFRFEREISLGGFSILEAVAA